MCSVLTFEPAFSFHGDPFPLKWTSKGKLAPWTAEGRTLVTSASRSCLSGLVILTGDRERGEGGG